jgi:diazepam-binding inhibitor (GABA receptor modulating acyl-CoA-binding protein)
METEKDLFLEAVANAPRLNGSPSNEEKGTLYGLYKQATVGDVNTTQPYFYEVMARGKWDAWNANKSKTSEQAKQEYIAFVGNLIVKYGLMIPV